LEQRVLVSQSGEWSPVGYPEASTVSQDISKGYLLKVFLKRYTATLSAKAPAAPGGCVGKIPPPTPSLVI
jgi:hypothetical protein